MDIKIITDEESIEIISTREPLGLFIVPYEGVIVGMDNSTGHANVEEFETVEECIAWLKDEEHYGDINEVEIYKEALEKWGPDLQKVVAIEEISELITELNKDLAGLIKMLSKNIRGQNNRLEIAEEIADVEIMLAQMKILFNIHEGVARHKKYKIKRLEERLNS